MNKRFRQLCIAISIILTVSLTLPLCAGAGETVARGKTVRSGVAAGAEKKSASRSEEESEIRVHIVNTGAEKEEDDSALSVSGLLITDVEDPYAAADAPADGSASADAKEEKYAYGDADAAGLDGEAEVVSAEGITWEIPVFWVNSEQKLVRKGIPGRDCLPVLAFFLPEGYSVGDGTDKSFEVALDAYLSGLFREAGGAVCIYEPRTNITYILAEGVDTGFLNGTDGKEPAKEVPGLPEDMRKPSDGTYDNPAKEDTEETEPEESAETANGSDEDSEEIEEETESSEESSEESPGEQEESEEPEEESAEKQEESEESAKEPSEEQEQSGEPAEGSDEQLTREQLLGHCADNTIEAYGEDAMADFVDLIINCIQPQAVNLIRTKFPAFASAAENGGLGAEIGLYVYRNQMDEGDETESHAGAQRNLLAYVDRVVKKVDGEDKIVYLLGINTGWFEAEDAEGNLSIDTSEAAIADLDNTIVHEMFHAFMTDYNRTAATGMTDLSVYWNKSAFKRSYSTYAAPEWFVEGLASAVENNYQFRYESYQLLRYEDEGVFGDRYTASNLLKAYTTTKFVLENGRTYRETYDLEDSSGEITPVYLTGELASLYLGELAARYDDLGTSVSVDDEGGRKVSSETIRLGINSILERMHNGESLDEIIYSISDGRYKDTDDFQAKFIKGIKGDDKQYQGDKESIGFVVDYLNYMLDIGKNSAKIPNGSILFDFDRDYTTPIDRSVTMEEDVYQITDSDDYVVSTVQPDMPYTDGGKSKPGGSSSNTAASGSLSETDTAMKDNDLLAAKTGGNVYSEDEETGTQEAAEESVTEPEVTEEPLAAEETAAEPDPHKEEPEADREPAAEEPAAEESAAEESVAEFPSGEPSAEEISVQEPVSEEVPSGETAAEVVPVQESVSEEVSSGEPASEEVPETTE